MAEYYGIVAHDIVKSGKVRHGANQAQHFDGLGWFQSVKIVERHNKIDFQMGHFIFYLISQFGGGFPPGRQIRGRNRFQTTGDKTCARNPVTCELCQWCYLAGRLLCVTKHVVGERGRFFPQLAVLSVQPAQFLCVFLIKDCSYWCEQTFDGTFPGGTEPGGNFQDVSFWWDKRNHFFQQQI
ncbi:Uncharacterised protein [Salmonella enterica subsp. enterica serovar Bovismorbificans]|uniref:Uncharacterized protein n=1 Tax=Salmonella enterica subsp. enterica serovar Bovismorbificans TaxID=58097 RepID=A0A655C9B5_SALET|nr:Uncharacterised protein [Salmonella enterica subsp. enterica serovar Bovismorbificans]CNV00416.1 Uncharacterised protein [Salmonella enterica subsp. enterica serovar Bovismorbificans]CNV07944.1 Uncharacterised protein [Salmonella enterica subsp. enterica serovar Bovismorbificans]